MRMYSKINVLCLFVLLMVPNVCFGANWYVDKSAVGSNNGTSWESAWTTFASINWAAMTNGDILYISGGTTSKIYTERMTVGRSYVSIKPGQAAPHNGQVIIQPAQGSTASIAISSKENVVISGSGGAGLYGIKVVGNCTGSSSGSVQVTGTGRGVIVEYLEITAVNMPDGGCIRYTVAQSAVSGSEIRNNWIHDCYQDGIDLAITPSAKASGYGTGVAIHHNIVEKVHDDHIESTMGGLDIYNNTFANRIAPALGHPDGHQLYNSYYRIYNNHYSGFTNATSGNSVIYWEPDGGENMDLNNHQPCCFNVYNNTFFENNIASSSMTGIQLGLSDSRFTSITDLYIGNNTFLGAFPGSALVAGYGGTNLCKSGIRNMYVVNNVFDRSSSSSTAWSFSSPSCAGTPMDYGSWGSGASWVIDYNIYTGSGSSEVNDALHGGFTAYNTWKAATGAQVHGSTSSSLITSPAFLPQIGSPAIDKGVSLLSLMGFNSDKAGTPRPLGNAWDIGAYENTGAVTLEKTPLYPAQVQIN